MSKMLKASGAMAAATLLSRVLGMVREMVYARFMGDGWVASAFTFAFQIPNLFRRLLGEGALTAAFIPIFKEKEKSHGEIEMWRSANAVISGLVIVTSIVVAIGILGISVALPMVKNAAPQNIVAAADHFSATDNLLSQDRDKQFNSEHKWERAILMLQLLRLMFPYLLLVCLAAAFMGMLNARGHFFIPAMGATALNVVMIASVLWLAPRMGKQLPEQVFALAYGVLAAGVAQAAFQLPTLWHDGFRYHWVSPWENETVRVVVKRMIPGAVGLAAFQINVLLTQMIAFWVNPHIVASFNYAVRLMELPQGMFGVSLATFLLPTLAGLAAEKNHSEFRATLRHGLGTLIFTNLIAAILLVVLAEPIVRLLFERGEFTAASTQRATLALMCLAPGLVAFSSVNILARAFYALGDTQTPMKISIGCLVLNLVLAAALIMPLQQGGIGLANTVTSTCNAALLLFALRRKLGQLEMKSLCEMAPKLLLITTVAGLIAWQGWRLWENSLGHATLPLKIGAVFVPAGIAGSVYLLAALWFEIPAAKEIVELALVKFRKNKQK